MKHLFTLILSLFASCIFGQSWLIDKNGCKVFNPYPRPNQTIEWTGECIDSIALGSGELIWFKNGRQTGDKYTGEMANGMPNGNGIYVLSKNTRLEGEFKDGYLIKGTKFHTSGSYSYVYIGEFDNNEIVGFGEMIVKGSYKYVGEFKNGIENGQGTWYDDNGEIFEGTFKDGYYVHGKLTIPSEMIIIGDFAKFQPYFGTIIYQDSMRYEGDIKNYVPHGEGTIYLTDGGILKCHWKNRTASGPGEYKLSNDVIYKGSWVNGNIDGKGQIIYPDGKVNIGIWEKGVLIEEINGH